MDTNRRGWAYIKEDARRSADTSERSAIDAMKKLSRAGLESEVVESMATMERYNISGRGYGYQREVLKALRASDDPAHQEFARKFGHHFDPSLSTNRRGG